MSRGLFKYLGSKGRVVDRYPAPQYQKIIEPFCGSAAYSFRHYTKDIHINDINPRLIGLWKYLQAARAEDIRMLPRLTKGMRISTLTHLREPERYLLSIYANPAAAGGRGLRDTVVSWAKKSGGTTFRSYVADSLYKIRHWAITCDDYRALPDIEATWFVDPPYQHLDKSYTYSKIDYSDLALWCRSRRGQVIVCDSTNSDWLPFRPACTIKGPKNSIRVERVWTGEG